MNDLRPGQRPQDRVVHEPEAVRKVAWAAATVGLIAAASGVVVGLVMAFHRNVVGCPDGHFTPVGGDPNCYSYPEAGLGSSIALLSIAAGALILLACTVLLSLGAIRLEHR